MNQLDEYELEEYDNLEKRNLKSESEEAEHTIKGINEALQEIMNADNTRTILEKTKTLHFRMDMIRQAYFNIIHIKEKLQHIGLEEADELRKETDNVEMYCKIKDFRKQDYEKDIDQMTFIPEKGTYHYSKCKGYNYLSRVEMGRMIKKDLKEEYPECQFSVTTEEGYWKDRVNVRFSKAPKEQYGDVTSMGKQALKREFIDELQEWCKEYEPRVNVSVYGHIY